MAVKKMPNLKFDVFIGLNSPRLVLSSNSFVTANSKKYLTGDIYSSHLSPFQMLSVLFVNPENNIKGTKTAGAISTANVADYTTVPINMPKIVATYTYRMAPPKRVKKHLADKLKLIIKYIRVTKMIGNIDVNKSSIVIFDRK